MEKESRWSLFKQKLHDKYKLTIMNKAFEEKFSLELSKLNVFVIISLSILLLITLTTLLIALTPLKEYIPGYGSTQQNKRLFNLQVQVDSLQHQLNDYEIFIRNMQQVFLEEDFSADSNAFQRKAAQPEKNTTFAFSKEDSLLLNITLQKQEAEGNASTRIEQKNKKKYNMLFQPVFGKLMRRYSEQQPAVGILTFPTNLCNCGRERHSYAGKRDMLHPASGQHDQHLQELRPASGAKKRICAGRTSHRPYKARFQYNLYRNLEPRAHHQSTNLL